MLAKRLFKRNLDWANSLRYDLNQVHSPKVVEMLHATADQLLLDAQILSVGIRALAAYHEDLGSVFVANERQRSRSIVEFNLLIGNVGSGKSTIINRLINVARKKQVFESNPLISENKSKPEEKYRHGIIQEFTGAGIVKTLNETGNLFVVVDEFDGHHQQCGMFPCEGKRLNSTINACSILKSLHTGLSDYQKTISSENIVVTNPHLCFLGASNGGVLLDIIQYKLKNPNIPDPMVMRTVFDSIKSTPKFNADYANRTWPEECVGLELFMLASSLLTNQSYFFEEGSDSSANSIILKYMDSMIAAVAKWEDVDLWISSRFAKSCELVSRLAAQLAHIDQTMEILQSFIQEKQIKNPGDNVSFERYSQLKQFVRTHCDSPDHVVYINERQVTSAIYVTNLTLLKFFNLLNTDPAKLYPFESVPLDPTQDTFTNNAVSMVSLRSTQTTTSTIFEENDQLSQKRSIMLFDSIAFTRTMLYKSSGFRFNKLHLDQLLNDLVIVNLLKKYERGAVSYRSHLDVYVKLLPSSLEQQTVANWQASTLDQLKLSWSTYSASCSTLRYPSAIAKFSNDLDHLLKTDPYKDMIQTQIRPSSKKATTNSTDCVSEELSTSLVDRTHEFETQLPTVNVAQVPSSLSPADVTVTTIIDDDLHSTENERDLIDSSSPLDLSLPRVPTNILNNHVSTSPSTLPSIIDTHVTATTYDNFDLEDNTSISMTESIPTENDLSRPSLGQMESDCYIDVETIGEEDHSRQDFSNEPLTVVENVVQRKSSRLATIRRKRFYSPDEDQIKTSRRKSKKKT